MRPNTWLPFLLAACTVSAIAFADPPEGPSAPGEPPPPAASPAVRKLLEDAAGVEQKDPNGAVAAATTAVAAARAGRDQAGEAWALRELALRLEAKGRKQEAQTAWREAAEAWARVEHGPGEAEALGHVALEVAEAAGAVPGARTLRRRWDTFIPVWDAPQALALVERITGLARGERKRPLSMADALASLSGRFHARQMFALASHLRSAAVEIQRAKLPNRLELADSIRTLGDMRFWEFRLPEAERLTLDALSIAQSVAPESATTARCLTQTGFLKEFLSDPEGALIYNRQALVHWKRLEQPGMVVQILHRLGTIARNLGDLPLARRYYQEALDVTADVSPNSAEPARRLWHLAQVAPDPASAESLLRKALQIASAEPRADNPRFLVSLYLSLATVQEQRGDKEAAKASRARYLAALEPFFRQPSEYPGLLNEGSLQAYLNDCKDRGDLAEARRFGDRVLETYGSEQTEVLADLLVTLSRVAMRQGDFAAADRYIQRVLQTSDRGGHIHPRTTLFALQGAAASILLRDGRLVKAVLAGGSAPVFRPEELEAAEGYVQRALKMGAAVGQESRVHANSLAVLALVSFCQGNFAKADTEARSALEILEKTDPNSAATSLLLQGLAIVAQRLGDREAAGKYLARSLAIQRQASTVERATALALFPEPQEDDREATAAEQQAREAWRLICAQADAVTGDEARLEYHRLFGAIASRLIRLQAAHGNGEAALATLEESRAQALRVLLAERGLEAKVVGSERWAAYRQAAQRRDRSHQALTRSGEAELTARKALDAARADKVALNQLTPLQAEWDRARRSLQDAEAAYTDARVRSDMLWYQVREAAPRVFPPGFDLEQTVRALPAGTLYLGFLVGPELTHLFILRRPDAAAPQPTGTQPGVRVVTLPVKSSELERLVAELRREVGTSGPGRGARIVGADGAGADGWNRAARTLYTTLFPALVREEIADAKRLLISPDGPLWEVPFAALPPGGEGAPQYLGLEKPISYTPSLAVYVQSQGVRTAPARNARLSVLVVGDPVFSRRGGMEAATRGGDTERRRFFGEGVEPARLPGTRQEASRVAALYGARPLLGNAPTEREVRKQIGGADILHLATHGFLHPVRANSSGILLTPPGEKRGGESTADDGLLQAWEFYSDPGLKLRADLAVLSACETGRGENVAHEGLLGLTRALQVAGARSVVASQWQVSDPSTAALMVHFHKELRGGAAKDEALRRAMAAVAGDPKTSHPYHWAAFLLVGDLGNHLPGSPPAPPR